MISVIMGVYNCESTLAEAIESILNQTYTDWELLICDDASVDDTWKIAKHYQSQYPQRIVVFRNEEHRHLAYSLNRCLGKATGTYVARMDGDDVSEPDRFEKQLAFLMAHPTIDLVGTAMQRFDDDGTCGVVDRRTPFPDKNAVKHPPVFNHATIMTYKYVYDALSGYAELPRTAWGEDVDLWARFLHHGFCGANMAEVLYRVRENDAAFRRRTLKKRWLACRNTWAAYRLLGYPWWYYIKPFVGMAKALVPTSIMRWYHRCGISK